MTLTPGQKRMLAAEPLTKRQQQVLDFIRAHINERQCPPTVRNIMDHFGFTGPNGALCHLKALTKKGYIERDYNISRGIRLTSIGKSSGGIRFAVAVEGGRLIDSLGNVI